MRNQFYMQAKREAFTSAMEKLAFIRTLKNYAKETVDLTKDFIKRPGAVSREAMGNIWNPPGSGWKGKAFSRVFGVGLPLMSVASMAANPGETSFEDIGRFGGMQAGIMAAPFSRVSIPAALALSFGGEYAGGKAGKILDQVTGRGLAVERRRQAHALQ